MGGEEPVVDEARKSVSCERTFAPLTKLPAILDKLGACECFLCLCCQADFCAKETSRLPALPCTESSKEDALPHSD